jgi:hypothetical protein
MDWQSPPELPDLRRAGIIALDLETRDDRLRADKGSGWPFKAGYICGVSVAWREAIEHNKGPVANVDRIREGQIVAVLEPNARAAQRTCCRIVAFVEAVNDA